MERSLTDYPIHFESLSNGLPVDRYSAVFVLTDTNTLTFCYPILQKALVSPDRATPIELSPGEASKSLESCRYIWDQLLAHRADRKALLINLGGGVVCDIGGFVAATYKRGIDFIHMPTSLLAQVDAAIGGKTGIDIRGEKNMVGLFARPAAVIIDPEFLDTLPPEQFRSGWAEMIKHGLIEGGKHWHRLQLKNRSDPEQVKPLIRDSVAIKQKIVEADPLEQNIRKTLNLGHTIGHALETYTLVDSENPMLHGEAIAAGMIMELNVSVQKGLMTPGLFEEISRYIFDVFGQRHFPESDIPRIIGYLQQDKKKEQGMIYCTLLKSPGTPVLDVPCSTEELASALQHYRSVLQP